MSEKFDKNGETNERDISNLREILELIQITKPLYLHGITYADL